MRISPDYRLSRLTSPLPLTDITIDYSFISPQPSIATFSLFPSRNNSPSNASSGQSFSSMIQSNDLGCWFQVSGKAPSVESQQSQACAGLGCGSHWCQHNLAGSSVLSNSIGLSPGLKQKFLPQKSLQKLLSRAFKGEFLLMVLTKRWHQMYCARYQVSPVSALPA